MPVKNIGNTFIIKSIKALYHTCHRNTSIYPPLGKDMLILKPDYDRINVLILKEGLSCHSLIQK